MKKILIGLILQMTVTSCQKSKEYTLTLEFSEETVLVQSHGFKSSTAQLSVFINGDTVSTNGKEIKLGMGNMLDGVVIRTTGDKERILTQINNLSANKIKKNDFSVSENQNYVVWVKTFHQYHILNLCLTSKDSAELIGKTVDKISQYWLDNWLEPGKIIKIETSKN